MPMVLLSTQTHLLLRKLVNRRAESGKFGSRSPSNDEIIFEGLELLSVKERTK